MQQTENKPNVLVVDDIASNLVLLAEMIQKAGCIPRPVKRVEQAWRAIRHRLPQLILLDISMPDIDGFEFCAMLKKDVQTREIPVIFISALNSPQDKVRAFQLGAVDYISKPYDQTELSMRINTHLNNYRLQQKLENYNSQLHKLVNEQIIKIEEEQRHMLRAMAALTTQRFPYAAHHMELVGSNSRILAMALQFSNEFEKDITQGFVENIGLAARLHDVGEIGLEDALLCKKGVFTPQERQRMQEHTVTGGRMLEELYESGTGNQSVRMASQIAYSHHERWDGSGYPYGYKGRAIPLAARIVSIVDAFEAMTGQRCYREPLSVKEALLQLEQQRGKQFDPNILDVFLTIQNQIRQ